MAKKKTKNSMGKTFASIFAIVLSLLTSLALFLNVWVWKIAASGGETLTDVGGYFEDMKSYETVFKLAQKELPVWGTKLAGVCVIIALVCAVVFTLCTIVNMAKKSNKTVNTISKIACLVMILAGLGALVGSVAFVVVEVGSTITSSMTMAFGAIAGFVFPILGGTLGLAANRK